jgi:phage head maturation protease
MAQRSVTREIPRLEFRALVSPDTLNEEKRTVDVIWTTGARVLRGYFDQFWEELSLDPKHVRMDRLNGGAPLLDSHDGYSLDGVIGVVESARLEEGQGVATVRFAKAEDDPRADKIFRKVKDGIIRNVSVGYQINKMEKVAEERARSPSTARSTGPLTKFRSFRSVPMLAPVCVATSHE